MAQAIETVIMQAVRKAGDDGLRISEIVTAVKRAHRLPARVPGPRYAVAQVLFTLREQRALKMTGERRAARYFINPFKKAKKR